MGKDTKISWADNTFSPWIGCTKVSPGCTNCYAADLDARRFGGGHFGLGKPRKRTSAKAWREPLKWEAEAIASGVRTRIFCASLSDCLDSEVPIEWLIDLLALIERTPHLDWLLLTKRPESWRERLSNAAMDLPAFHMIRYWLEGKAPANVWVGTTVEDQKRANERVPALLSIPARVHFLSMEPLLEKVDLFQARRPSHWVNTCEFSARNTALGSLNLVIVGGESGPDARPFDSEWAKQVVLDCGKAGVACWVKQMGENPFENGVSVLGKYLKHHAADPSEWNEDLRVQELPQI